MRVGRNDPCPCGSGRKYKRCCLPKERPEPAPPLRRGLDRAMEWLDRRRAEEVVEILGREYLSSLGRSLEEVYGRLEDLPQDLRQLILANGWEWLLAEGALELGDGERRPAAEIVLGPGGPLLAVEERAALEELARRPLRLYEVLASRPGAGLRLRDVTGSGADEPRWVEERSGSRQVVRGDILGLRLVSLQGVWQVSVIYPFQRREGALLRDQVRRELEALAEESGEGREPAPRLPGRLIVAAWLDRVVGPTELPEPVDAATGDPIVLVTERYEVADWGALAAALAAQPDVEGDREEGWTRFAELDDRRRRSLLQLDPGRGGRLESFARTLAYADEGRRWLEAIAGDAVAFRSREIEDPRAAVEGRRGRVPAAPSVPMTREMMQEVYHQTYHDWADRPIPALGERTPREAAQSAEGRERLRELLEEYENGELHQALLQQREPASLRFLWEAVGLERDSRG